jgi:hypothetical protein
MATIDTNDFSNSPGPDSLAYVPDLLLQLDELSTLAEAGRSSVDDVPTALSSECSCPEFCERDHDRD